MVSGHAEETHDKAMSRVHQKRSWDKFIAFGIAVLLCFFCSVSAKAEETGQADSDAAANRQLLEQYREYQERLYAVEEETQIQENGFEIIEDQIFPLEAARFGEVRLTPAMDKRYHRLVLFLVGAEGNVVWRTEQLAANSWSVGSLEQPIRGISAIAFQDVNRDGRTDIVLIADCRNSSGAYGGRNYKVGDVLFQSDTGFYRDYRISDKINRFGMNKSAESIIAYVRDGYSTEFLYTASTKAELLRHGFQVVEEQDYSRQFEKLGYLEVMPGTYTMAEYATFMIYLVNEQGNIVWSFQPMGDFDNLYALKGIQCRDIDGDGMKDILVLARYSYAGDGNELLTQSDYRIYYQRTGGFETDTQVRAKVPCSEKDTVAELVEKARAYWGWSPET